MSAYLGVDGGKTKTLALVVDENAEPIGEGRAGNCDLYDAVSDEQAVAEVVRAVRQALDKAGVDTVDAAAFRLASVDWPEDHAFWRTAIAEHLPGLGAKISVENDGLAALRCGEPSGLGVALVAGTGTAVAARGPDGTTWAASFWLQEGIGAGDLGRHALRAICEADLGLGPSTTLTRRFLEHFGERDVEALLHFFTRRRDPGDWEAYAGVAREVTDAVREGDEVATGIVTRLAQSFAQYVEVAARKVGWGEGEPFPVVLAGSVLTAPGSPVAQAIEDALATTIPYARTTRATLHPVMGAALDAMAEAG